MQTAQMPDPSPPRTAAARTATISDPTVTTIACPSLMRPAGIGLSGLNVVS